MQGFQEGLHTGGGRVGLELHEHLAHGPVDGHDQVAPAALVLHLWQVLHINMHVDWLVALEGLLSGNRLLELEGIEIVMLHGDAGTAPDPNERHRDSGTPA